ncbi:hypothetical protein LT330_003919 [Penicillium expansum]|nr:hypothetical protein LT330_003919 [Penicillium expansum]
MSTPQRLRVAIIGGGIAGTMAACVLREHHDVTIFERGSENAIGGGQAISLSPGSVKILNQFGFDEDRAGAVSGRGFKVYHQNGTLKKVIPIDVAERFGAEWLMTLRSDARDEILRIATADSAEVGRTGIPPRVVYNVKVVGIDVDSGVVTFADGSSVEVDLIIVADGIRSKFREQIVGNSDSHVKSAGKSIFRFVLSAEQAKEVTGTLHEWWDPSKGGFSHMIPAEDETNRILIAYPAKKFGYVNFSYICPNSYVKETGEESWFTDGDRDELLEVFKDFPENMLQFIRRAEEVKIWSLRDHDPLPSYVRGRAVLVGDAAHAMTPLQGQGANQAIEDAEGFRLFTQYNVTREAVPALLKTWDGVRRPRATQVQLNTRSAGTAMNETNGLKNMAYNWTYDGILNAL